MQVHTTPNLTIVYRYEYLQREAMTAWVDIWETPTNTDKQRRNAQRRFDRRTKQIGALIRASTDAQRKTLMTLTDLTVRDIDAYL